MLALFSGTLFLSAFLLFLVQPMFAKMILPRLGGTPAVWNTCVVFFQLALFAGYLYAHASIRWLGPRKQALIHLGVMLLPIAVLPIALSDAWIPPASANPIGWLLLLLAASVGLPFLAVSTSAPLLQRWFAETPHPSSHDPFFLYAASNLGSLGALLAYPLIVEPMLSLRTQSLVWAGGYIALLATVALCALAVRRSPSRYGLRATGYGRETRTPQETRSTSHEELSTPHAARSTQHAARGTQHDLSVGVRLRWLALSAVPTSLLLSVTTYLTLDVAAVPLLWIGPLALYLLSFVIVFARRPIIPHNFASMTLPMAVIFPLLGIVQGGTPALWTIPLHLASFFWVCLVCHGELVRTRPSAEHLTEFYLWISAGGAVGGLFTALIAPLIFLTTLEYPLGMIAACLLRPAPPPDPSAKPLEQRFGVLGRGLVVAMPVLLAALVIGLARLSEAGTTPAARLLADGRVVYAVPMAIGVLFWQRPIIFALCLAGVLFGSALVPDEDMDLYRGRTFFGTHRVYDRGEFRYLLHGTTNHGMQALDPARRCEPVAYYTPTGPIGQVFASFTGDFDKTRVAMVGLGSGGLVTYSKPSQQWTIYEINPEVERIAGEYFTYLDSCAAPHSIVIGDARTSIAGAADSGYDFIIFDAFSSDAIPMHLLTREAFSLYLRKLAPRGVMAFHISNRHLDLTPVIDAAARDLGLVAFVQSDDGLTQEDIDKGKMATTWAVVARSVRDLGSLARESRWAQLPRNPHSTLWTDDYSNILSVLKIW